MNVLDMQAMQAATPTPAIVPAEYIVLDIETIAGRPEDAEAQFRAEWRPAATWKAETVAKRYEEARIRYEERGGLIDTSPIACAAMLIATPGMPPQRICYHAMAQHEPRTAGGTSAVIVGFPSQHEFLAATAAALDRLAGPDTVLAGHHVLGFDLPRLRLALVRERISLPTCLVPGEQPVYDTMRRYWSGFATRGDSLMISLVELADRLGVQSCKDLADGSDVQGMYERGEWETICTYCLLDVETEAECFRRMTGRTT